LPRVFSLSSSTIRSTPNSTLFPYTTLFRSRAAEKAVADADDMAALPPLTGVPIPIKDLNMVAGVRQTLGSKAFEANVPDADDNRSEEHTSELQSRGHLVCRLLLEKKKHGT